MVCTSAVANTAGGPRKSTVEDRRREPRYELTLFIRIGDAWGITRNFSTEAVLFDGPAHYTAGEVVDLTVYLPREDREVVMRLAGVGEIVRSEAIGNERFSTVANLRTLRVLTDVPATQFRPALSS
jgi:hypothetical protein